MQMLGKSTRNMGHKLRGKTGTGNTKQCVNFHKYTSEFSSLNKTFFLHLRLLT